MAITISYTIDDPVSFGLSVLIPTVIAVSVWLAGNKNRWSWPLGLSVQALSGIYAFVSHDLGWLISPIVVGPVFIRNWVKWHREAHENDVPDEAVVTQSDNTSMKMEHTVGR